MSKFADGESFWGRLVLQTHPALSMTDDEFYLFCQMNRELRIERSAEGELIVMAPSGFETGYRNADITTQLRIWAAKDNRGVVGDSSTGYILPNGAERSPDASFVLRSRLTPLTAEQKRKFLPLCPDFVIELGSPTDRLGPLQEKMAEYVANGALLGWLIDPTDRTISIFRPNEAIQTLNEPATLSGQPEMPDFVLDLAEVWQPRL
jgi:Uma2 family endonuclease